MKQREIKFRFWNKKKEQMEYPFELGYFNFMTEKLDTSKRLFYFETYEDKCDVMQYTGLKDKDGNEIYEGDVLIITKENDCPENDHYFPIPINTLVVVEEIKNAWGLQRIERVKKRKENDNKCDACAAWWLSLWSENHEMPITCYSKVIGNIYENPELLKED